MKCEQCGKKGAKMRIMGGISQYLCDECNTASSVGSLLWTIVFLIVGVAVGKGLGFI